MRDKLLEAALLVLLLAVGLIIAAVGSSYYEQLLFNTALYVLLAIGWNVISGFTGYVSFGQVGFFGIGAYVAAICMLHLDLPWYFAVPVAAIGAIVVALPIGAIMLRLNGIFFALGMFGLARILQIIASSLRLTGGPMGTTVATAESVGASAIAILVVAAAAVLATYAMLRSRFGLRLLAVRDDSVAAQAAGVNVWLVKVMAFCISAGMAAIGGGLYVWNVGYLDPSSAFNGTIELQTVLMVMAGGIGTVWGPVVGGVLISILSTALWARFPTEQEIILGALTMGLAVLMPGGLMAWVGQRGWLSRAPIWGPPPAISAAGPAAANVHARQEKPVLHCNGLGIRFGGVIALEDVDLAAFPGEMLAVIGPNGAGKSTLFNLMSAFARPTAGGVHFCDHPIAGMRPDHLARSGVARTFQTSRLFPSLCVWETVLLAAASLHRGKEQARAQAALILHQVGLEGHWRELPETLPPGRQRLLEIARALALRPKVLLLDEAMAGMSATEIDSVHAALRAAMRGGCSVVAVEHVLPAVAPLAARVQVLDFGRTIASGVPNKVLNDPVVITAYLGAAEEDLADA